MPQFERERMKLGREIKKKLSTLDRKVDNSVSLYEAIFEVSVGIAPLLD